MAFPKLANAGAEDFDQGLLFPLHRWCLYHLAGVVPIPRDEARLI